MKPSLSYQDISLVPRNLSQVSSRQEIDLSLDLTPNIPSSKLRLPVLPAPMDTICSLEMCKILSKNGMIGMIHRFQPVETRKDNYKDLKNDGFDAVIAVGLDEKVIIDEFYSLGARAFIIDVANGFNTAVEPTVKQIRDLNKTYIFCGNVDSEEGKGTKVTAVFQPSHPDMKPLGDILETMMVLVAGNPSTQFVLDYKKGDENYHFDSYA